MFATMLVALYTSRVVLRVLGASDYGLYSVVGGIVTMFSMFSGTLSLGTQRFLNIAMGENDFLKLKKVFSIAFGLHVYTALIVFVLAETVGLWFLYTQMNIPDNRMTAALWVYQFSIIAFIASLIQIPFNSSIIAHEAFNIYAYMSIYDVVMKLLVVYLLTISTIDKLIFYALLVMLVNISSMLIYNFYCQRHYSECRWKINWEKGLAMQILNYSEWNIFGSSVGFATGQGVNILLNIFCGTIVNAARAISVTVSTYLTQFVNNFQTAVNPQLIKMYAAKEYEQMYRLTINSCRINAYFFLLMAIPLGIEIKFVLQIWLGEYPPLTDLFVQIILIQSFLNCINRPLITHIHASGKMKMPNLTDGIGLLLILPISYIILKLGYGPIPVLWANSLIWIVDIFFSIYWPNRYTGIPIKLVLKQVFGNVILGASLMLLIPYIASTFMQEGLIRFFVVCGVSVATSLIVIYFWGMTPGMKDLLKSKLHIGNK